MVWEGKEAASMETQAAIYCRLSQDDGSLGESGSIQTQKAILTQYCQEHHMEIVDCYCDDGWSGTNFDRPAFQRMIGDIEAGRVNTVIVKDLSRFGREYAQMGLPGAEQPCPSLYQRNQLPLCAPSLRKDKGGPSC